MKKELSKKEQGRLVAPVSERSCPIAFSILVRMSPSLYNLSSYQVSCP
jgi:hypothetical protein